MQKTVKENATDIFYVVAASTNISMFFKERAATSKKILRKNVLHLKDIKKKNVQLLLRIMST